MEYQIIRSDSRGAADFGWFKAQYSFSFGQYHDPKRMGFGALRVLNDSSIAPGKGFPEHPHENFEIITVQFQGNLVHTDVSGTRNIRENMVQAISAGTGVTHSDLNRSEDEALQFQIWILPNKMNVEPRSEIASFDPADWTGKWKTLVGPEGDGDLTLRIYQEAYISRGAFAKGREMDYTVKKEGNGIYLMVITGELRLHENSLFKKDAMAVSGAPSLSFNCIEDCDILIIEVPVTLNGTH